MTEIILFTTTGKELVLNTQQPLLYRYEGQHRIDISSKELPRSAVEMLCILVAAQGEYVLYEELLKNTKNCQVQDLNEWAGKLRKIFEDQRGEASRIIVNKSKHGYRFSGKSTPATAEAPRSNLFPVESTKPSDDWLKKFWAPHYRHKKLTFVYTESTFFRSTNNFKVLTRHVEVNRCKPGEDPPRMRPITDEMVMVAKERLICGGSGSEPDNSVILLRPRTTAKRLLPKSTPTSTPSKPALRNDTRAAFSPSRV